MILELVPIEGERILTEEEKQWQKFRARSIPPEALRRFHPEQQKEIKIFLVKLVALSEQCHHAMEQLEKADDQHRERYVDELERLNQRRIHLFTNLPAYLKAFNELLALCATEPWKELAEFLKNIRGENTGRFRDTKLNTGIAAAMDNPFLLQLEDDIEDHRMEMQTNCRITPREIELLILLLPLETLVRHLINARRVSSGQFWDKGFYDL
ncbi:MAG TPA: hypothetical protein VIM41_01960 [Gammaproteobacteria bacterium]